MYLVVVVLTTVGLPITSLAIEVLVRPEVTLLGAAGKWFVFWGVGVRLLLAGVSQVLRPSFTATDIFLIKGVAAAKIVSELGYANISIGLIGTLSLIWAAWRVPAALAGGLFLGLAGAKHALNAERSAKENVAMTTDLFVAGVVALYLVALTVH